LVDEPRHEAVAWADRVRRLDTVSVRDKPNREMVAARVTVAPGGACRVSVAVGCDATTTVPVRDADLEPGTNTATETVREDDGVSVFCGSGIVSVPDVRVAESQVPVRLLSCVEVAVGGTCVAVPVGRTDAETELVADAVPVAKPVAVTVPVAKPVAVTVPVGGSVEVTVVPVAVGDCGGCVRDAEGVTKVNGIASTA
jgi:hypothetical protein